MIIGITLGDPGGIGPEVVVKALAGPEEAPAASFVLFGHASVLDAAERITGVRLERKSLPLVEPPALPSPSGGPRPAADNGAASFAYFEDAVGAAREGRIDALVTGPVSESRLESRRPAMARAYRIPGTKLSRGDHDLLVGPAQGRAPQPPSPDPRGSGSRHARQPPSLLDLSRRGRPGRPAGRGRISRRRPQSPRRGERGARARGDRGGRARHRGCPRRRRARLRTGTGPMSCSGPPSTSRTRSP